MVGSAPEAPRLRDGLRLLVVEDEAMISMLVEDMLTELGHHVIAVAASLEEAASLAADAEFDAALLDVNLNGQTVDAVADTLARRGKPFIFTSGYGERAIPPAFKDRQLLPKPYELHRLSEALIRLMRAA
jgi:CheY-like chemotaxis protein